MTKYKIPKEIKTKSIYIGDMLNFAEQHGGIVYFLDEYKQPWKLSKMVKRTSLLNKVKEKRK